MNKEDYFKYYIQGSDHYLIPKDVFIELFNEMVNWREESKELNKKYLNAVADYETTMSELQELKKQLEKAQEKIILLKASKPMLEYKKALEENQQKDFIEYINEKIDICDGFIDTIRSDLENISYGGRIAGKTYIANEIMKNEVAKKTLEEILSKYKEIIGDDK